MSGNIRVTPEELFSKAGQFDTASGEVMELIGKLDGYISELEGMWEGEASVAFLEQYERLKPSFMNMSDLLNQISQQLNNTGETMQSTDSQIAGSFRG
ncbi:WXG100 family type VII secretion target [Salicibibacter cibarius]|uniref:ESAT-6-like protein n=1 Tax=Salicibibacter cibarius TaxID=2743000 RepID=A0A7T6Z6B6_9BACI|nr:WXG100 family type VII secretion target [Salicibibacter cibarius]QQK77601.1 WXG100 family type VII secretion target [Salicibibacter cibarius]